MNTPFISYSQNAEDVVLWRVFRDIQSGCYVDVGAADPVEYSVTRAFYEAGWRGVNVEPVPEYAQALRAHRPGDVVVQKAAGPSSGVLRLNVATGTGLSTLSNDVAQRVSGHGFGFHQVDVEVATLDEILDDAGLRGSDIHFLKIDVEGFEAEVLAGLSLNRWKPWVLVVEATEPLTEETSHERWESCVLSNGYEFCLFDGLNRFYVSEAHPELSQRLSYPACVFDQPFQRAEASLAVERARGESHEVLVAMRHEQAKLIQQVADRDDLAQLAEQRIERNQLLVEQVGNIRQQVLLLQGQLAQNRHHLGELAHKLVTTEADRDGYHQRLIDLAAELAAIQRSTAYRLTKPVRSTHRSARRPSAARTVVVEQLGAGPEREVVDISLRRQPWEIAADQDVADQVRAFALRVTQATHLLRGDNVTLDAGDVPPLEEFADAIAKSPSPPAQVAWLALVVSEARYPNEGELRGASRLLHNGGSSSLVAEVVRRFEVLLAERRGPKVGLDVRYDVALVDITHTASNDLHTGIQRVVRQVCSRWFLNEDVIPVYWNHADGVLRALASSERERMVSWMEHLHESGSVFGGRFPEEESGAPLVPWRSRLVIPELAAEAPRCDGYRALATSGTLSGLSYLVYDLIPITAPETVAEGMPGAFANYLSNVKYADRVSAISEASAVDYRAFAAALASQRLAGPEVAAHLLPVDEPMIDPDERARLEKGLDPAGGPLILVVGSHEPRKNHLVILDAAEQLWKKGIWFQLIFMGGSGWRDEDFNLEVNRLRDDGHPVRVMKRVSEGCLWAGYSLARFTVFPSIVEGFGLPIAESLRCGTPVVTSDYGSMAEVAAGGGAIMVDPRDQDALSATMEQLLCSDEALAAVTAGAEARRWKTWDEYAVEVWAHLVPERPITEKAETEASDD